MDNQSTTQAPATTSAGASNDKLMGVLAYIGILVLIPILAAKDSKFAQYHSNQGLWLLIFGIGATVINVIPVLGQIISCVVIIAVVVYSILGIINVVNDKMEPLPGFASLPTLIK